MPHWHTERMARHIDLSHVVTDGITTYPGLPTPVVFEHLSRDAAEAIYGPGVTFQIGMITMCSNTGTYIDVPFHRFADGHDLSQLELDRVTQVPGVCIDCRGHAVIGPELLDGVELAGRAVLLLTGHSAHFGRPTYLEDHPYLSVAAAECLVDGGASVVGIDSLNIDAITGDAGAGRPVHTALLGAGIPIVEHLTQLERLPRDGFTFTAVPPKVVGMGTFTVRAHATID